MGYVWMAVVGFFVGLIARALMPGEQKLGLILTCLLGIAGSFVANLLGQALGWYKAGDAAGFLASVVGALILLLAYKLFSQGSSGGSAGGTPGGS